MRYLLHARRGVEVFKFDKIHTRETPKTSWRSHAIADITSYAATLPTSGRRSMKSYVSADYVFDSASHRPYEPDDPIHPLNVYGVSKAAGENAVREESKHWLITRTWWLFGASRTSFPEKDPAGGGLPAQDQGRCRSKRVADLFEGFAMPSVIWSDARGILHITTSGSSSWFEFAKEVLVKAGRRTPILAITTTESDRLAKRPTYSVLSPASLTAHGITLRSWQEAVDAYLTELRRKSKMDW